MKKTLFAFTIICATSYSTNYNVIITKDHNDYINEDVITPPETPVDEGESCKKILDNGLSTGDGIYNITNNEKTYPVYCNMTSFGGGWTLVTAQYKSNPITWNEGIQTDYDPSLVTKQSFSLNANELPIHTESAFTQEEIGFSIQGFFNFEYINGDIQKTTIQNNIGENYQIHRSSSMHYVSHDPESMIGSNDLNWQNTLTVDKEGGVQYSYAFAPQHTTVNYRGYAWNGTKRITTTIPGAWMVWVR